MTKKVKVSDNWYHLLETEFESDYFQQLTEFVRQEYQSTIVYPPPKQIFAAFDSCEPEDVKVVILGQDPYHGPNQANGLAFSVNTGVAIPPSLQNIYKEIKADIGQLTYGNGDLTGWAKQGVLMLNATLTVRAGAAASHQGKGWEQFTDSIIKALSKSEKNLVFLLWGAYAQKKAELIDQDKHLILKTVHPSPLSAHRGFFGCKHFSKTNNYLEQHNQNPIIW